MTNTHSRIHTHTTPITTILIMVALWNRVDHYIFILWFLSTYLLLLLFPRLISVAAQWMSTILPHMV